jgi:hypothetical protein
VSRDSRERAVLPVARHAPEDEALVPFQRDIRPQAQSLHHSRAKALDQRIGTLDQAQHELPSGWVLQVDRHGRPPAANGVGTGGAEQVRLIRALQTDDVGAHVGEQHRGERAGSDARDLNHLDALQGSHD